MVCVCVFLRSGKRRKERKDRVSRHRKDFNYGWMKSSKKCSMYSEKRLDSPNSRSGSMPEKTFQVATGTRGHSPQTVEGHWVWVILWTGTHSQHPSRMLGPVKGSFRSLSYLTEQWPLLLNGSRVHIKLAAMRRLINLLVLSHSVTSLIQVYVP